MHIITMHATITRYNTDKKYVRALWAIYLNVYILNSAKTAIRRHDSRIRVIAFTLFN